MAGLRRLDDVWNRARAQPFPVVPAAPDWLFDVSYLPAAPALVLHLSGLAFQNRHYTLRRLRDLSQSDAVVSGTGAGRCRDDAVLADHRWLAGPHRTSTHARLI